MEKQVERFGPFQDFIADGVKVGNVIYLSGQVSVDHSGQVVGAGDFGIQIRQAYSNIKAILTKYGASMTNIIDEMWLITDMDQAMGNIKELFDIREKCYGGTPQVTQTMVQVAALVMPELLIEIKCVAYLE